MRQQHANKKQVPLWPLAKARANKTPVDWAAYAPPVPKFIGRRVFRNFDLTELAKYIDWGPFFQTWDLAGPFPAILKDEVVGTEAVRVYADGQRMLKRLIEGRWLTRQRRGRLLAGQHAWTTTTSRSTPTSRAARSR